jgi:glycolate oxidase FAD binding subunit
MTSEAFQTLFPTTSEEMAEAVRSAPRVLAVGAGTKPRLSAVGSDVVRVATTKLSGIIEYEPSEFTFTALAGTTVREIAATLAARGQYLPFDPLLLQAGATIGGTVAAGMSGPGRWRFGGLRDFILGVRFVDGAGRLVRMGGKVVKNAAGFDVPKFFVGGLGRFGALTELTFKVFPKPAAWMTLQLVARDPAAMQGLLQGVANTRWELDAVEASLSEPIVFVRLAGPPSSHEALALEITSRYPGTIVSEISGLEIWRRITEFSWAQPLGTMAKFSLTPAQTVAFTGWVKAQAGARGWIAAAGNVGFVARPDGNFPPSPWPGILFRGEGPLWLGPRRDAAIMHAVKAALDPVQRFPALDA